jgi:hypothetical protein
MLENIKVLRLIPAIKTQFFETLLRGWKGSKFKNGNRSKNRIMLKQILADTF